MYCLVLYILPLSSFHSRLKLSICLLRQLTQWPVSTPACSCTCLSASYFQRFGEREGHVAEFHQLRARQGRHRKDDREKYSYAPECYVSICVRLSHRCISTLLLYMIVVHF